MQVKRDRIFRAAAELFDERGFAAVTTQEISERADVAAGTLFRYASSKSELLLMVYNEEFGRAITSGLERAAGEEDVIDAIVGLVTPVVERARERSENSIAYQRELLFGSPTERFRSEGLALVARLESAIADRLVREAESRGCAADEDAARLAGAAVFAVMHLAVARMSTGAHPGHDATEDLRRQIGQIVTGFLQAR
ncbi:TetR/AcrR family transcriptional regulator [Micromonospora aurantiaca (nom. illeg.)]|uniref:TetR/AcrR family transcriptional regulator n=1 Tax=Micromonospora aurantiaca (nom. illeg.) TaxID=47850 RepID=UPI001656A5FF|nr:TetR/AcrR family transcriptional regulator [Micromonospora aurantiaca]MBC9004895.1 TetR/AcrR family transcriptional regulator [Micromonospora aurantiaca]